MLLATYSSVTVEGDAADRYRHSYITNFTVLRGGIGDGLLMLVRSADSATFAADAPSSSIARGSCVQHEGLTWACLFSIHEYWFAVPVGARKALAQWQDAEDGASEESVIKCLKRPTPTKADREQLCDGVSTGIVALDVLAPIGQGQSLLICGPRSSGKSTLACEITEEVLAANSFDRVVRFCLSSCAPSLDAALAGRHSLKELSATAPESASPAAFLGPLLEAIAAAEETLYAGGRALIVLDTLAPITDAWDLGMRWAEATCGSALDEDSVSSQRRTFFANIFERAANLAQGGSLTLLALVDTGAFAALGSSTTSANEISDSNATYDISDFTGRRESEQERIRRLQDRGIALTDATLKAIGIAPPDDAARSSQAQHSLLMRELQSISDGQVVLDKAMAETSSFPALAPGATFSRFGLGSTEAAPGAGVSRVQRDVRPTALQAVAAHLRVELALENDARFRAPVQAAAGAAEAEARAADVAQSARMESVRAALLQPRQARLQTEEMVALLLGACSGAFDALSGEQRQQLLSGGSGAPYLQHLRSAAPQVLKKIKDETHMSAETARELDVAIRLFVALQLPS